MSWIPTKSQYSRYWIGDSFSFVRTKDETAADFLMRLSKVRKGISNFVQILTGKSIPIKFSSGHMSYTNGEDYIIISATDKPEEFDSMVGLALHESEHVVHSQPIFDLFAAMATAPDMFVPSDLFELGRKVERDVRIISQDLKLILNFLEDRRIDFLAYESLGGYRPYYEEMYHRYFYSEFINLALQEPFLRNPWWKCYELHVLNMFNEHADPDALPGLRKIWEIIDLPHITRYNKDPRWTSWSSHAIRRPASDSALPKSAYYVESELPLIAQDALNILRIIYGNLVVNPSMPDMNTPSDETYVEDDDSSDGEGGEGKDENLDIPQDMSSTSARKKLDKELKKQSRFTQGRVKKDELPQGAEGTMDHLETADAELREAGESISPNARCPVVVYKKVDWSVLSHPEFPFSSFRPQETGESIEHFREDGGLKSAFTIRGVQEGIRMGSILAHRIRILNDESTTTYTRQTHGKLDKRLIHSLGYETDNVFSIDHQIRSKPVMVDLSIDASGSMNGVKWERAISIAVAFAYAASKIRTMNVRISLRSAPFSSAAVAVVYDSRTDTFAKVRTMFPYLRPEGGTPEGLCFEAIQRELLAEIRQTRRYFINLSDGEPAHSWIPAGKISSVEYSGEPAALHTREQVNELRRAGVKILSYFISEHSPSNKQHAIKHSLFEKMYGTSAAFVDVTNATEIVNVLNRLLLSEDR